MTNRERTVVFAISSRVRSRRNNSDHLNLRESRCTFILVSNKLIARGQISLANDFMLNHQCTFFLAYTTSGSHHVKRKTSFPLKFHLIYLHISRRRAWPEPRRRWRSIQPSVIISSHPRRWLHSISWWCRRSWHSRPYHPPLHQHWSCRLICAKWSRELLPAPWRFVKCW